LLKNQKRKLKNFLYSRQQSLIEKITVDMFIGVIHLSLLIRENLEQPKAGVKKKSFHNIIEDL